MGGKARRAGQLIRRGPSWLLRVYVGRDPQTGRRRYINRTVRGNKREAQAILNEMLLEKDRGQLMAPSRQTVNEYLERWLEASYARVSRRTADGYKQVLNLYVQPVIGNRRLDQLTPLEIQELINGMTADGYSSGTVRKAHSVLRNALNQAVKWRQLPYNPAAHVDLPRIERRPPTVLSPGEADRFLEAAKESPHYALFALLLTTGLRPGEALALRWSDVDLAAGTLSVQRAVTGRDNDRRFVQPKTPRSRRAVPIPATVIGLLKEHRRRQAEERLAAPLEQEYEDQDLIFAGPDGRTLKYRPLVRLHFKPLLERAGLSPETRLYDLRHTCATLLLSAGENPKVVAERLGHANISMTLDTYSHVLPSMQQRATEKLEDMLFGGDR